MPRPITVPVRGSLSSFPDENPNPVLRITRDGTLVYANRASDLLVETLSSRVGGNVPESLLARLAAAGEGASKRGFEVECGYQTFAILVVPTPDFDAWNVYGTDITASKVVEKFPDMNPNPVLRITPDGALIYANEASGVIVRALRVAPG